LLLIVFLLHENSLSTRVRYKLFGMDWKVFLGWLTGGGSTCDRNATKLFAYVSVLQPHYATSPLHCPP